VLIVWYVLKFAIVHEPASLSVTFASNVGLSPPIKSATDLFVCSVTVRFIFPEFRRTNCPFVPAPLHDVFVPSLSRIAKLAPPVTAPLPKSKRAVVKVRDAKSDIVTLTTPVALSVVAYPVNLIPIKNSDIMITAIATYPMISVVFMTVPLLLVYLQLERG